MSNVMRVGSTFAVGVALALVMSAGGLQAQGANNPYHAFDGWEKLPGGTVFGALTGAFPDPDGRHMWMLSRCGENICADSDMDPVLKFDMDGNVVDSFGAGLFGFPHGFYLDPRGIPVGDRGRARRRQSRSTWVPARVGPHGHQTQPAWRRNDDPG